MRFGTRPSPAVDDRLRAHVQKVWLTPDGDESPVAVSLRTPPPGHTVVEEYAVLPHPRMARFLVPLASPRLAAATFFEYNAIRSPLSRAVRLALAGGFALGLTRVVQRHRLLVSVDRRVSRSDWTRLLVTRHLAEVLGRQELHAFVALRQVNPNAKPTLEMFDEFAAPAGYAKLGTTEATKELVRTDAATIGELDGGGGRLLVPRLLAAGDWNETAYTIVEPLPRGVRRWTGGVQATISSMRAVAATGVVSRNPFAGSSYAARLRGELAAIDGQNEVTPMLWSWLRRLEQSPAPILFGRSHGDWIPDNVGRCGDQLAAWDWEHSNPDAPVGFDLLHWHFHHALVAKDLAAAVAAVYAATPQLELLDVAESTRRTVARAYLLDLFVRRTRLAAGGGGWNRRWYPALLEVLRHRSTRT